MGMGFPPLMAAVLTLVADSASVSFGAVGVPIHGGFEALRDVASLPESLSFSRFLQDIGFQVGLLHFAVGTFIPLIMVGLMTRMAEGSLRRAREIWKLALFAGLVFTLPQVLIARVIGPELPALLGALIGLPIFLFAVSRGFLTPKTDWDFPDQKDWPEHWQGKIEAGTGIPDDQQTMSGWLAWLPYVVVGMLLLLTRIEFFQLSALLQRWNPGWSDILGTGISATLTPLYNPGVVPFLLIALLIPLMHGMNIQGVAASARSTLKMIAPASVALVSALAMVYIMINSGVGEDKESMLIVVAGAASDLAGQSWYLLAPLVGTLGTFISGSNTVSNIMFGVLQHDAAAQSGLHVVPVLALQAVGGAAGNMICVHNVVAVLATVGLLGKEGLVIRINLGIALGYALLAGGIVWGVAVFI
jgi:lactate permease